MLDFKTLGAGAAFTILVILALKIIGGKVGGGFNTTVGKI
jgi:hypothetical protein